MGRRGETLTPIADSGDESATRAPSFPAPFRLRGDIPFPLALHRLPPYPYAVTNARERASTYRPPIWSREDWLEVVRLNTRSTDTRFIATVLAYEVLYITDRGYTPEKVTTQYVADITGIAPYRVTRAIGRLKRIGLVEGVSGDWRLAYEFEWMEGE